MFARGGSNRDACARGPFWIALTCVFALTSTQALTIPRIAYAAEEATESAIQTVCGKPLAQAKQTTTSIIDDSNTAMKTNYCQAAKSAQEGADADSVLWKVWAAVGTVCTAACVSSFAGYTPLGGGQQYVCTGATLAGGITDAVVAKNFTGALMSIGSAAASLAMNEAIKKGSGTAEKAATENAEAASKEKPSKDIGACVSAGNAVYQSFTRYSSMKTQKAAAATNLASARSYNSEETNTVSESGSSTTVISSTGGGGSTGSGSSETTNESTSENTVQSSTCSQANGSSNSLLHISCAVASDKSLPNFVTSPRFQDNFKKTSGQNLDTFLGKAESPADSLLGSMAPSLNASQSVQLAAAIQQAQTQLDSGVEGSSYAGGGGGGLSGGEAEDDGFGSMMEGLMNQLMPKTGEPAAKNTGLAAVVFANQRRPASRIAEDPKLSIFDRVTFRYYAVGRRMVEVK